MIGIVGGMGPYAGLDLLKKIYDNTLAGSDQEHLDTILLSLSSRIPDRTEYLLGKVALNPALPITDVLLRLEKAGAVVAGIPCNTSHAAGIYTQILEQLERAGSEIRVLNMIGETVSFTCRQFPGFRTIGVLSTTGTYRSGIYSRALENAGFRVVVPEAEMQEELIHKAIYDPEYGIKTVSQPIHSRAIDNLERGIVNLKERGAEAVVLGCTEIPLAFPGSMVMDLPAIDPTTVLARALIRAISPEKLKPLAIFAKP